MKNHDTENTVIYDIRGQICPSCLLFALREVNEHKQALKNGDIQILIKTDNRQAISTIPDAVSSMGYDYSVAKIENHYEIRIMAHQ